MSVAAILALADKANAVEPAEAASHVRVPVGVLIEAARQIREREIRVGDVYQAIDSLNLGLPRAPIGVMAKAAAARIAHIIDDLRCDIGDVLYSAYMYDDKPHRFYSDIIKLARKYEPHKNMRKEIIRLMNPYKPHKKKGKK